MRYQSQRSTNLSVAWKRVQHTIQDCVAEDMPQQEASRFQILETSAQHLGRCEVLFRARPNRTQWDLVSHRENHETPTFFNSYAVVACDGRLSFFASRRQYNTHGANDIVSTLDNDCRNVAAMKTVRHKSWGENILHLIDLLFLQ